MVDDLTSTCGTLIAAAKQCADHGARSIHAAVTHGLLNETGLARLKASPITELIVTDTVPQHEYAADARITTLSVAELFGEAIRRTHLDESINDLFNHE